MKKIISIILATIFVFTMAMPAFATMESSRQSISVADSVEIPVLSSIFNKIREVLSKIYNFIMNLIFPKEELPGGDGDSDERIEITWNFLSDDATWVEITEYYEYGEELKLYSVPEKVREGGFSLTVHYFKGWSPEPEETVTKDMTYKAVYETAY